MTGLHAQPAQLPGSGVCLARLVPHLVDTWGGAHWRVLCHCRVLCHWRAGGEGFVLGWGVARAGWLQLAVLQASLDTETVCVIARGLHQMY